MKQTADIDDKVFHERLNAARKELIDLAVWQRHLHEKACLQAFGETMEEAIIRRFKDKHTIL